MDRETLSIDWRSSLWCGGDSSYMVMKCISALGHPPTRSLLWRWGSYWKYIYVYTLDGIGSLGFILSLCFNVLILELTMLRDLWRFVSCFSVFLNYAGNLWYRCDAIVFLFICLWRHVWLWVKVACFFPLKERLVVGLPRRRQSGRWWRHSIVVVAWYWPRAVQALLQYSEGCRVCN